MWGVEILGLFCDWIRLHCCGGGEGGDDDKREMLSRDVTRYVNLRSSKGLRLRESRVYSM